MKPVELQDGASADVVQENVQLLKEIFPDAFTENGVDFDTLRQLLGDLKVLDEGEEKYGLNWHGKKQARQIALTPSLGTLLPCPEESVDWDTTQNLFIEGDNLEVLKLLQKSYANKVKMIYIDPPYNTGKEFVYPDKFQDNLDTYLKYTGQIDSEGVKFSSNTETGGRKHTNWLNMMYPRLKLAKNLLRPEGVIFVSIGVEELTNLKSVMDEVFGEENFVEIFSWVKTSTPPALSTKSRKTNEYILCYEKNKSGYRYNGEKLDGGDQPLLNSGNRIRQLTFPKGVIKFNKDKYPDGEIQASTPDRVTIVKPFTIEGAKNSSEVVLEGEFKWTQDFLNNEIKNGTIFVVKSDAFSIRFIRDEDGFKRPTNFIKEKYTTPVISKPISGVGTNENASSALTDLMGGDFFDYPKPVNLIGYLFNFVASEEDVVMDFFAGSGTTAHSVMNANLSGSKTKYILVQLPEILDPSSATDKKQREKVESTISFLNTLGKDGNIAELAKERIRRAAKKIKDENPDYDGDLGFKAFKLASSNIKVWNPDRTDLEASLLDHKEHLVDGRSEQDILYELLLKRGVDLTTPIETRQIAGKNVYSIGYGKIITCLDDLIAVDDVEALASGMIAWQSDLKAALGVKVLETHVFFKDSTFRDDIAKTNMAAILSQNGIEHVRSL